MADVEKDRPVTYRYFNALVQLFKEERAKTDADRKERDEERVKAEQIVSQFWPRRRIKEV